LNQCRDNRAKWQGWRNGMCDIGLKIIDDGQRSNEYLLEIASFMNMLQKEIDYGD
jgi:hypothetical protein